MSRTHCNTFHTGLRAIRDWGTGTTSVCDNRPITVHPSMLCLLHNTSVPKLGAFTTCDGTRKIFPFSKFTVHCFYKLQHKVFISNVSAHYIIYFLPGSGQSGWPGTEVQLRFVTTGPSQSIPPFSACWTIFLWPIWVPSPHVTGQGRYSHSPNSQSTVFTSFNIRF